MQDVDTDGGDEPGAAEFGADVDEVGAAELGMPEAGLADPGRPDSGLADLDDRGAPNTAGYRRSAGSPRGRARRQELLDRVTADLAEQGLVGFSLRRAAKAAGTTHKVLLYHFPSAEDLLREAVERLRERRAELGLEAAQSAASGTLAERVRAVWPLLAGPVAGGRALDQALGLAMYDPDRYGALARDASSRFLPPLRALCPPQWDERRRQEVAELTFAALRGFLVQRRTGGPDENGDAGFAALLRMLDREEQDAAECGSG